MKKLTLLLATALFLCAGQTSYAQKDKALGKDKKTTTATTPANENQATPTETKATPGAKTKTSTKTTTTTKPSADAIPTKQEEKQNTDQQNNQNQQQNGQNQQQGKGGKHDNKHAGKHDHKHGDKHDHKAKGHGPPAWAPAHGYRKRFVYFPKQETYYDNEKGVYISKDIKDPKKWIETAEMPSILKGVDLTKAVKVEIDPATETPQSDHDNTRKKYPVNFKIANVGP